MKRYCFVILSLLFACSLFAQGEYKKFNLSLHGSMEFPMGTSTTPGIDPELTLPFTSHGFGGTLDATYFFTKNYGVGLKYHLFRGKVDDAELFLIENVEYVKAIEYDFTETTHFVGPAFYARWTLGKSRWEIPANISLGFVRNIQSDYVEKITYIYLSETDYVIIDLPIGRKYILNDMKSNSLGVMLSAGLRYRISSSFGVAAYATGMFSSADKQKMESSLTAETITIDSPREMNRIGFSVGVDYCF